MLIRGVGVDKKVGRGGLEVDREVGTSYLSGLERGGGVI